MKLIIAILFIFLVCVATKPIKTPYNGGFFPPVKIVEQNGEIKIKVNTPDSTYSYSEILTALSKHWNVVKSDFASSVQFVNEDQDMLITIKRDSVFNSSFPKYDIKFEGNQPKTEGDYRNNLPFMYVMGNNFRICRYKGKNLYGRVKIVDHDADFKIKQVSIDVEGDMYVTTTPEAPDRCGNWHIVKDNSYDFTVQFVEKDPDFTVYHYGPWETPEEEKQEAYSEANQEEDSQTQTVYSTGYGWETITDCKCKGIPLHGRVQVVSAYATFKVQLVASASDLNVCKVLSSPSGCGEWQFVDYAPDFTIEFVPSFPDFTIKYVDSSPGQN